MQFIGASLWAWDDKLAYKVRNRTNRYVVPNENSLLILRDPRYFEFFEDQAKQIWVRRPAGKQTLLAKPYIIVTRQVIPGTDTYELVSKEVVDA